jgi:hypothetical protein
MFNFLTKLPKLVLFYKIYKWIEPRFGIIIKISILLILIFYAHSEYLKYLEFSSKASGSYVGISFVIKNLLIILVLTGYLYFSNFLKATKEEIDEKIFSNITNETKEEAEEKIIKTGNKSTSMVENLDQFLEEDELDRN